MQWCWQIPTITSSDWRSLTKRIEDRTGNGGCRNDMAIQELEETPHGDENCEQLVWIWDVFGVHFICIIILCCCNNKISTRQKTKGVLFGLVQSFHSVSTLTPSVLIDSVRRPLLFARMARTSDISLILSTTVLNFCNGGNRICNYIQSMVISPTKHRRKK
jgi:hypothetical protein